MGVGLPGGDQLVPLQLPDHRPIQRPGLVLDKLDRPAPGQGDVEVQRTVRLWSKVQNGVR